MDIIRPGVGMELEAVGIEPAEEAVYRLLLERPGIRVGEMSAELGVTSRDIRSSLLHLERAGLVTRTPERPGRYVPASPEAAIEVLVLNRRRDLERARVAARRMEASFQAARALRPGPMDVIEVVLGPDAVGRRFLHVVGMTREQMRVFDRPPYQLDPSEPNELELELLERGISNRAIYDTEGLTVPGRIRTLRTLAEAGEEGRTLPGLPLKLFIADDRLAFIPLSTDEPGMEGALVVHPSPVLDGLITLFETLWERAVPLDLRGNRARASSGTQTGPSPRERELLALLTAGLKDQAIARQLGVAPRTVLRRAAALMTSLDAQTRFQAGWLAARRWPDVGI